MAGVADSRADLRRVERDERDAGRLEVGEAHLAASRQAGRRPMTMMS
jgi:hypothetical protein